MNKNIAFDLDGTLITCKSKQVMLLKYLASSNHICITELDLFWELKRDGCSTLRALQALGINESISKKISRDWINEIEDWYWLTYDTVYEGVFNMLDSLKPGNKLYLLTARRNKKNLYRQLDQLGLMNYFDDVIPVEHNNVALNKKDFLVKASCDFFVGDTETDYQATLGTSVKFIGCTNGQRSKIFLSRKGVEHFYNDKIISGE